MNFFMVVVVLCVLAYFAYEWAWGILSPLTLSKSFPDKLPEEIMGWDLLEYTVPFIVIGAFLALFVVPLLTRGYRAANRADLERAVRKAKDSAERAHQHATNAERDAQRAMENRYAERLHQLRAGEAKLNEATACLKSERVWMNETVAELTEKMEQAVEEAAIANKAKNNASAASARQRKKLQKLEARIEQLMSGGKPVNDGESGDTP